MKYGLESHKGLVREINEDSCDIIFGELKRTAAFMVADGMGGHNAGEIASKMAVAHISERLKHIPGDLDEKALHDYINKSIEEINAAIYQKSMEPGPYYGMGTTLVVALFFNGKLHVVHIGDSRAYIIRNGKMTQITIDHSYVEELIKNGSLTRGEAENHPQKHVITRALGCFEKAEVDIFTCDVCEDDIFLLCTDGLTNMLSDDEIKSIVIDNEEPQAACSELVKAANANGGNDNITVIVIRV
ncbi:MAG: Stp1/IreP family PP2C-type Ser/Thr phosphatase [Clostridiaceae bacterium]|nr:Stp1/IreP family PP2C-type Ser/Thr phosphatase [Clostridiaceae bacterium]